MQQNYSKIQAAGLGLAAISYDSPAILKSFADRQHIAFPLLSDTGSKIIREYGILNTTVKPDAPFYGIPNPGIYFVTPQGKVKAKYFEEDYKERQTTALILMKELGIAPATAHTSVSGKHLTLSQSASTATTRMGQHIALILDIDLPERVHVYAPGVKGYIPIDWKMTDSRAIKPAPVTYPAAKTMRLEAINETVPVYQSHFRLTRELVVASDPEIAPLLDAAGNFTIEGSLRYQACDDEKCFLPETIPLKWSLHFDPLDRVRASK